MRAVQNAGRASSSRVYRAATRAVAGWLGLYVRGVDPRDAADRTAEVQFELWEHAFVADRRWSPASAAAGLLIRGAAGVPRDLSWRHAVRNDRSPALYPPAHLLARRHRQRFWVPMQNGHVFDQTNGMVEGERAKPYERPDDSFGAAGNAFGLQGGF